MKFFLVIILGITSINLYALSPFWIGTGTITHNFLTAQNKASGKTKILEFAPAVFTGVTIPLFNTGVYLAPGLGYAKFYPKDNTSKTEYIIQYHFVSSASSIFQVRYGFSNYITKISGDGGTLTLSNGNGTAIFYTPKETETSFTASADIAGDFIFTSNWTARMQFSLLRFLSSTSRRVSNIITINYYF